MRPCCSQPSGTRRITCFQVPTAWSGRLLTASSLQRTGLYMKKQSKQSPADSQGIIELMHGHMVIIKERAQVDPKPYWIRHWSWRKVAHSDAYE